MILAMTGATGYLGTTMFNYFKDRGYYVYPVGHSIKKDLEYGVRPDFVIHLAAPNHRNELAMFRFRNEFLEPLTVWTREHNIPVVSAGTWWQRGSEQAKSMTYTKIKDWQEHNLDACTLLPYSIYQDNERERGFIPQLIKHIKGVKPLVSCNSQPRDWIHALDVCSAFELAILQEAEGRFDVGTGKQYSPAELTKIFTGDTLPEHGEFPNTVPPTELTWLPHWEPRVDVLEHIKERI